MKKRERVPILALCAVIIIVCIGVVLANKDKLPNLFVFSRSSPYEIYQRARLYTVFILRPIEAPFGDADFMRISSGSGWIIDENGKSLIVTNRHVVSEDGAYYIQLDDKTSSNAYLEAKRLGWDAYFDLALLEFADANVRPQGRAVLGNSELLKVTDDVYTVGNPLGLKFLFLPGSVVGISSGYVTDMKLNPIVSDTTCNPGNSGGPLINSKGEAVGIVSAIGGNHPLCLSIPVNVLKILLPKLMAGGEIKHGSLGLKLADLGTLPPEAKRKLGFGDLNGSGVIVTEVESNSPADKAGIKKGDVLLSFGRGAEEMNLEITATGAFLEKLNLTFFLGDDVFVKFKRDNDYLVRKMTLADPSTFGPPQAPPTPDLRDNQNQIPGM